MKRFITLTAAAITTVAALSGAASAQAYNTGDNARAALQRIAPTANVEALTNSQAIAVYQLVQDENSAADKKASVEAAVHNYQ
ncbi:hypothetical protein [Salipiger bermudensis]|uniref:DUF4148 domain-containing protein n=1 Tax=Salipiger bermudensis (strain DSM 26914 / JCM 13377 / KCTC 12554 / HTCC2601) TaxID=314265 RepID=Q0FQB5_SALBH|nr:hypothetical protein [Salipiger bermudensis]EAU46332.1 hypothetical protein R2601_09762 [Salipiger bermudensis HTCC2601]MBN9674223.1 hypothetical protein [Salipiger bermudensis]MBR9890374.1 hypothetical protein [bacterium]MCA1288560.1 hypothetical protein [Salipiger bermudensis]